MYNCTFHILDLYNSPKFSLKLISGQVVNQSIVKWISKASATEMVDLGSIPSWVKSKMIKIGVYTTASLLDFQH